MLRFSGAERSVACGSLRKPAGRACGHGDGGMGDGPAGKGLVPAPVPIAHTSQMMSDSYLFRRISEGGAQFETAP